MYVNAPRYLLRKFCVLKLISDVAKGTALDVGCGAGDMCETLYRRGFAVKGIDFSDDAIQLCKERLKDLINDKSLRFQVEDIDQIKESFDLVIFLEVLEHIKDDSSALQNIHKLLNPGGHLILSVPANKKWFGPSDRYVGHYRRYDREELIHLLEEHNFEIKNIWSYGVPLANLTERIRNVIYARKEMKNKEEGTKQSGIDRTIEARFRFVLNDFFLFPFYWLQMLFRSTKLGSGFIVKASKAK